MTAEADGPDAIRPREITSLAQAATVFPGATSTLVYAPRRGSPPPAVVPGVDVVPLWRFLLDPTQGR